MPMPPWTCTAPWPTALSALPMRTLAALAARVRSRAGASSFIAASQVSAEACSIWICMSTMRCCRAWNEPIGTPNCLRSLA
ncbi:hypothetical protein D3C80_1487480 [compost metagenome]